MVGVDGCACLVGVEVGVCLVGAELRLGVDLGVSVCEGATWHSEGWCALAWSDSGADGGGGGALQEGTFGVLSGRNSASSTLM